MRCKMSSYGSWLRLRANRSATRSDSPRCACSRCADDRGADYSHLDALSLIADNSWNAGVVQGVSLPPVDLGALAGALHVDGELVMTGSIVTTRFAKAGEHYYFELAGLPPAELWVN